MLSIDHICKASVYNGSHEVLFVLMKKSQTQTQLVGGFSDPWTVSGFSETKYILNYDYFSLDYVVSWHGSIKSTIKYFHFLEHCKFVSCFSTASYLQQFLDLGLIFLYHLWYKFIIIMPEV